MFTIVHALVLAGQELYVGGDFANIGGLARNSLAKLSTTGTGAADPTWNPSVLGAVHALVLSGPDLYVGGGFGSISGATRSNLAKISATGTGALNPTWASNANNLVYALALSGSDLYVGGRFTSISGQPRTSLAKLATTGSGAVDANWTPAPNGGSVVYALAASGPDLFVGGDFMAIGGQSRGGLAKLATTGTGAVDTNWGPGFFGDVHALYIAGSQLFVGVTPVNLIGGTFSEHKCLARIRKSDRELDMTWRPDVTGGGFGATVNALALAGSDLYVGGIFTQVGGQARSGLARVSTSGTGAVDATWNPGTSGLVRALALSGPHLYVGGSFANIGGLARNNLAKLSTTGTGAVDATWNPSPTGSISSGFVSTLALAGTNLYVGGAFSQIRGQTVGNIASVGTTGVGAANQTWGSGASGWVSQVALLGEDLYVVGDFTTIAGQTRTRLAKLGATTGAIDANWAPSANAPVNALLLSGTDVYVGGSFTAINGEPRRGLAKLAAIGTGALDPAWAPSVTGSPVLALATSGPELYVGGNFSSIDGQSQTNFGILAIPTTTQPTITGLAPTGGVVGGQVTIIGTNLGGATAVSFNNLAATTFLVNSSTQLIATVPPGATTGRITVTTPAGVATSATDFIVWPVPTITGFTPTSGPAGTVVTITGTGFVGNVRGYAVINGPLNGFTNLTVNSDTQITASLPLYADGNGKLFVTTPGGTATSPGDFTMFPTWNGYSWTVRKPTATDHAFIVPLSPYEPSLNPYESFEARDLAVLPGASLVLGQPYLEYLGQGVTATVHGTLTNQGSLTVRPGGALVQPVGGTLNNAGAFATQQSGQAGPAYNLWASPVPGTPLAALGGNPAWRYLYDESLVPRWQTAPAGGLMALGRGYTAVGPAR
jgi:hypothetical protein